MNIHPDVLDGINGSVRALIADAAQAHIDTGRVATVTLRLTIKKNKETHKHELRGRVSASIPEGVDDSHTKRGEGVLLLAVSNDHPGQRLISDDRNNP